MRESILVPKIITGSLQATEDHSMGVVDPPLRSLGSPFPHNDGKTLAAPPPLQIQQRLLSTTPSTWTAVSTATGPLEDTARTLFRVPVFFVCWPPPRISTFPPPFHSTRIPPTCAARPGQRRRFHQTREEHWLRFRPFTCSPLSHCRRCRRCLPQHSPQ